MAARYSLTTTYAKRLIDAPPARALDSSDSRFAAQAERIARVSNGGVRVSVFGKTDLGRTRDHNEDTFLVADLTTGQASLQPDVRRHEIGPRGSLFMVADGMGGAAAGEVASQMAADLIFRHLLDGVTADAETSSERFAYRMREAVEQGLQIGVEAHELPWKTVRAAVTATIPAARPIGATQPPAMRSRIRRLGAGPESR
jgi:hypothetical protein